MLGAIIGDVAGSKYEWHSIKHKRFKLLDKGCFPTDDTFMTCAVASAILNCNGDYEDLSDEAIIEMQRFGRRYPHGGYGGHFIGWLRADDPKPYNSFGNGSAMRVSPCAYAGKTLDEVKELARKVTIVSHNHEEGIKGAEATAVAIFMALHGSTKDEIKKYISDNYYNLDFTLDEIRAEYKFDVTCQGSVPESIVAFLESDSFEGAIKNAISLGGDADTQGAIAGSIAEAYYGVSDELMDEVFKYIDDNLKILVLKFREKFIKG